MIFFTGVSATQLLIHWSYPVISQQNGIITHYVISYTSSLFPSLTNEVNYTLTNPSYPDTDDYYLNITGLQEYVTYTFTVSASTVIGIGSSSSDIISTLQAGKQNTFAVSFLVAYNLIVRFITVFM